MMFKLKGVFKVFHGWYLSFSQDNIKPQFNYLRFHNASKRQPCLVALIFREYYTIGWIFVYHFRFRHCGSLQNA